MNWLTNFVKPSLKKFVKAQEVPEDLWIQCVKCSQAIFHHDLSGNQKVCPNCGYHFRISPEERFKLLFDNEEYQLMAEPTTIIEDPLHFRDEKKYSDRLKQYRSKSKYSDALVVAHGKIEGNNVVIAAFNFGFMGGSMGSSVGESFVQAAALAIAQKASFITIPASGGARMQEGMISLMQMAKTTVAVEKLRQHRLPYIVVLSDPTTGGVSASFAMIGDIAIAEKGATIGFAGRRVIEQTIGEKLPEDFQTAEYLQKKGMVDIVIERQQLKDTLANVIAILMKKQDDNTIVTSL